MSRPRFPTHADQLGLVTRAQLLESGWTYKTVRHLAGGLGQEPFPGVYANHTGPLDRRHLVAAAAMWAGPVALLTGAANLEVRGLCSAEGHLLRFLTPTPHRCPPTSGATIVRTHRPLPIAERSGVLRLAPVARALVDTGRFREYSPSRLRALTIKALQRGCLTAEQLDEELRAGRRNNTKAIRLGLRDFTQGAWSLPEVWLQDAVVGVGLPPMLMNPRLHTLSGDFIGVPDGYFPSAGVGVQVHSREHHAGDGPNFASMWEQTVERDGRYAAHGILLLGVAPTTLRDHPGMFLDNVRSAISSQVGRPLPPVVATSTRAA